MKIKIIKSYNIDKFEYKTNKFLENVTKVIDTHYTTEKDYYRGTLYTIIIYEGENK